MPDAFTPSPSNRGKVNFSRCFGLRGRTLVLCSVAVLFGVAGCQGLRSREMSRIIIQRHRSGGELYVSDLPSLPLGSKVPETSTNVETYKQRSSPFKHDAHYYAIILDKDQHVFWIIKIGGFEGAHTIYGPGKLDQSKK